MAFAGLITGVSFSGPGGVGIDGATFANVTEPSLQFTSVDYIDVYVTVDSAGVYNINQAPGFGGLSNFTGQTLTSLTIENLTPEVGSFLIDWTLYSSPFTSLSNSSNVVVASGGAGVPNNTGMGIFGNYLANGPGTFVLRETVAVPEASTLALLGALGCGVPLLRRRRSSGAAAA
jgi:hypothetical protein